MLNLLPGLSGTSRLSRGRADDNIFVEQLWRSVKYEEAYLKDYQAVPKAAQGLGRYLPVYNHERPHQSFDGTPAGLYGLATPPWPAGKQDGMAG